MSTATKPWHLPERPVVVENTATTEENSTPQNHTPAPTAETAPAKQRTPLSRDQILDATQTCLSELGYDGTTIRKIASQLGCAVGSIYRYFKDKRDLLAGVTQRRFAPVLEKAEAGHALRDAIELYIRTAASEPEQYRLMFWLASLNDTQAERPLPDVIEQIIAKWAAQADTSADKVEEAWCMMHGGLMIGTPHQNLASRTLRLLGIEASSRPTMLPSSPVVVNAQAPEAEASVS